MIQETPTKVAVFGMGYVGCVSAACLARDGHQVIGLDINPDKVEAINAGCSPIKEAGLDRLIREMVARGRLAASQNARAAIRSSDVSLICVGTPSNGNGSLKLQYVQNVCGEIGEALADHDHYHIVVVRSTVLPGTVRLKLLPLLEEASGKKGGPDFGVCMNPEFLREGCAIEDYYEPSQIVIGEFDKTSGDKLEQLYRTVDAPTIRTSIETAEMVKYVNNAFHAVKVAFANEIGNLCKSHGIDGREVMDIFCRDRRLNISAAYLRPGFAFGGSCLPKDLRALLYDAKDVDVEVPLLDAVLRSNQLHAAKGTKLVESTGRKRIGVLGLSFKPDTDDVRESPTVALVETLVGRGYEVSIYDENVDPACLIGANRMFLERELPHVATLMRGSLDEVVEQSDVIVVANASKSFRRAPPALRADQVLIDLVGVTSGNRPTEGAYEGICW